MYGNAFMSLIRKVGSKSGCHGNIPCTNIMHMDILQCVVSCTKGQRENDECM